MRQLKITQRITDRTSSKSFGQYLAEVRTIKSFATPDDEYICALKSLNGDEKAFNELVNRNLKFVISVAKQYAGPKMPLEELVNEGNYGLIEAARKFDPTKGFKFISYAVWYIRKNIMDYSVKVSKPIRIPVNKVNDLNKIKNKISALEQIHERPICASDLVSNDDSDFDLDSVNMLLNIDSISIASLDSPFGDDSDNGSMVDILINNNSMGADELIIESDHKKLMDNMLSVLSIRQREVIVLTYGLNGEIPLNLVEISEKIEISRECVRQTKQKALKLLKIYMRKKGIKTEMFDL
jgi:RNA polymerase primary sigma factor